jgi:hypothetical protein
MHYSPASSAGFFRSTCVLNLDASSLMWHPMNIMGFILRIFFPVSDRETTLHTVGRLLFTRRLLYTRHGRPCLAIVTGSARMVSKADRTPFFVFAAEMTFLGVTLHTELANLAIMRRPTQGLPQARANVFFRQFMIV